MPMHVVDLGLALTHDSEAASGLEALARTDTAEWALWRVDPGQRAELDGATRAERGVLVLEGIASFSVGGVRQSLGSGHLLLIPEGEVVTVTNELERRLTALVSTVPPTPAAPTEAP